MCDIGFDADISMDSFADTDLSIDSVDTSTDVIDISEDAINTELTEASDISFTNVDEDIDIGTDNIPGDIIESEPMDVTIPEMSETEVNEYDSFIIEEDIANTELSEISDDNVDNDYCEIDDVIADSVDAEPMDVSIPEMDDTEREEFNQFLVNENEDIEENAQVDVEEVQENIDAIEDRADDLDNQNRFGSFETDQHINGSDSFVKGANYEQFIEDYYNVEDSLYEAYEESRVVDVSPDMIEGIHLGQTEMDNPEAFWSQHENEGTADSFKEIASCIPEVREQLANGKTISELINDSRLGKCTNIYFNDVPEVVENDGYYEFCRNGRHRVLAAREMGYDIPVKVIGKRTMKE